MAFEESDAATGERKTALRTRLTQLDSAIAASAALRGDPDIAALAQAKEAERQRVKEELRT